MKILRNLANLYFSGYVTIIICKAQIYILQLQKEGNYQINSFLVREGGKNGSFDGKGC